MLRTIAVMATLSGASQMAAIADWAHARAAAWADVFDRARPTVPHGATWTRIFGHAVNVVALEQAVAALTAGSHAREVPARGSLMINLDGNTVRGTIPLGQTPGVHLLARTRPMGQ